MTGSPSLDRSGRDRELAADHSGVERAVVFAQTLDVECSLHGGPIVLYFFPEADTPGS
jgi:hypothetical protein